MNERLKELMLEAGYAAPEVALRAQKLTELIVQECVNTLRTEMCRLDAIPGREVSAQTLDTAQSLIKKQFGVDQ